MIRYALRGLLYAGILLVLALTGAALLAQTGQGKRFLASTLSSTLSTPEAGIEITDLDGWLPIDARLGDLKLSDRDGVWLEANDIALDWSPSALFSGRLQIDVLAAKRVHVIRPPISSDEAEPPTDDPFRLPELPSSLAPLTLTEFTIDTIELDESVLGEAARFGLDGSLTASDDGRNVDLTLDLQRLDQATAFLTLISTVSLDPQRLAIDLDAGETGQLLEALTGRKDVGDLDLTLVGEGPLVDWSGKLSAAADGLVHMDADLSLALIDEPKLGIDASIRPVETVLPKDLAALLGHSLDIALDLTQNRAQAITLERLDIKAENLALKSDGTIDVESGNLALKTMIDAPDLSTLSAIAETALAGEAALTLDIGGTLSRPTGVLDLRTKGLRIANIDTSDLTTTANWRASAPLETTSPAFDITINGHVGGLTIPETPLPSEEFSLTAALHLPLEGVIDVEQATIEMAEASLSTTGTIDPKTFVSDLDILLRTVALNRLISRYGQAIDGEALIDIALKTTDQAESVIADLDIRLSRLTELPDGARELIGERLDLKSALRLDDQRHLGIKDFVLTGEQAILSGVADLDLETEEVTATIKTTLPQLAELASLTKQLIEGALVLDARIDGTLSSPRADLTATSDRLLIAGETIDIVHLNLDGRELLASPEGKLALDLTTRSIPLSLALDYHLDDKRLNLSAIDLKGPEMALNGKIDLDLDNNLFDGDVKGRLGNLAALEPLLEQPLQGALDLDLMLLTDNQRQDARLSLNGSSIGGDFGEIDGVDLEATIKDLLGKPNLVAEAGLQGFEQGDVSLAKLALQAQGDLERLAIDLNLEGEIIQPLSLTTKGALALSGPLTLDLERLTGSFAGEDVFLNRPLSLVQGENKTRLNGLDLRFGEAALTGEVDIGVMDVDGRIDLRSLPLALLQRFDGPEVTGTASAEVNFGGTVNQPVIKAVVNVNDIQAEGVTATDLPPTDMVLSANLADGRLASRLTASGLTQQPIAARIVHPLAMQWRPFAVDLPAEGLIDGEVKATVSLAHIGDLLALDGQSLEGTLTADVTLGGTIEAPIVDGPIALKDGAYENIFIGLALRDLTLDGKASKDRISVVQASAKAGDDGRVEAHGWINLDPNASFPLSLSLALSEAELVDRGDVEATLSGNLTMLGDLGEATIAGNVNVRRAEIQIPESSGPTLPDIDIEEIGGNIINVVKAEDVSAQSFDPELDLTIDLPNKVYMRGRGLDSEWEGLLRIKGSTSSPVITGNLDVKKGYFDFIEKRFEIEQGKIDFNGTSPPNPILIVKAAATDDDFKAIVNLDGPANDPQLRFSSEPALPEDEVLARLLFNRELSEIGPVEAGKLALALNKLRGGGGFDAFGEIRNALNIDTLDIVSGEEATDSRLKAGKYLNDDVYIEVEQGAGDDSSRARVEIEILPNVSLEADTGGDSSGGVGVKWRFDY